MQIRIIEMQPASRAHLPKKQDSYRLNKLREETFLLQVWNLSIFYRLSGSGLQGQ